MPFFAATYASSVGKIFATMGPYICRCSATTGEIESATKLAATAIYGNMPITYNANADMLFVGSGLTPVKQTINAWFNDPPVYKDVYQVNPVTLAVTPCGIITQINDGFGPSDGLRGGPYHLLSDGNFVYFLYLSAIGGNEWGRINAITLAYNGGDGFRWCSEQMTVDSSYVYRLDANQQQLEYFNKTGIPPNGGFIDAVNIAPHTPVGCCHSTLDDKIWIVNGDDNLLRVNSLVDLDYTIFNLSDSGVVPGPTLPPDPCRIQCIGGLLYLPCMTDNGVIIFNPLSGTGVYRSGFEGPMDIVSTGSKIFAVQNSPIGLKEIT